MRGSCHCGAVRFETRGEVRQASFCHCSQCRRQSGGVWASANVAREDLSIDGEVRWFMASDRARRGFCPRCGSYLFWEAIGSDAIAFALGAVDGPTGLRVTRHLFAPPPGPAQDELQQAACLCGAVTVTFDGGSDEVTACHCGQCRKVSGHLPFSIDDPGRHARIAGEVATYASPGGAVRSFCPTCGSKIAFEGPNGLLSIYIGLFDALAGREPDLHIFTADKGDYYDMAEDALAYPEGAPD